MKIGFCIEGELVGDDGGRGRTGSLLEMHRSNARMMVVLRQYQLTAEVLAKPNIRFETERLRILLTIDSTAG